ncbi:hypothetical protein PIB30_068119 [Stylosanthes scabra]|uniref:Uncharacterized protein n=1 Tax=Stylosanthes scabra TaxID=79078 RepID=A0ABU6SN81_9FABA|nr:hypothetical protein [Stylosanthes scabra]
MFRNAFDSLGFKNNNLKTHQPRVMGLDDNFIKPDGSIDLQMTIGKIIMAEFLVLQDSTAYNVILGRKTVNDLGVLF